MVVYNEYKIWAIRTDGLWYALVADGDTTVCSDGQGFEKREDAIDRGKEIVDTDIIKKRTSKR